MYKWQSENGNNTNSERHGDAKFHRTSKLSVPSGWGHKDSRELPPGL